ncbi:hypothetical protein Ccrd_012930 [Cynara cardunculus var. scolymus]|uniref:Uncharacterized protein n=1 Tax=Cynara cardunculus var. scolymus TaxID=59895 RepID=A0A103YGI7_CYNCS|nr:hypothetical protein Ccrd_012930 [Cynara cardunculus var. scolymus]
MVLTPCLAFSRALSVGDNPFHCLCHEQDTTSPPVSVNPYPWVTSNPRDSVRNNTAAGGGAPAVIMCTVWLSGSPSDDNMLSTTGAPHMWVTWWLRMAVYMVDASNFRRQTFVPPTAAIPQTKLHPFAWNIGRVHKQTGCFGTPHPRRVSRATINVPRWLWTTPFGAEVVPDVAGHGDGKMKLISCRNIGCKNRDDVASSDLEMGEG